MKRILFFFFISSCSLFSTEVKCKEGVKARLHKVNIIKNTIYVYSRLEISSIKAYVSTKVVLKNKKKNKIVELLYKRIKKKPGRKHIGTFKLCSKNGVYKFAKADVYMTGFK